MKRFKLIDPPNNTCRLTKKADAIGYTTVSIVIRSDSVAMWLRRLHVYIATRKT